MGHRGSTAVPLTMGLASAAGAMGAGRAGGEEFHYDLRRGLAAADIPAHSLAEIRAKWQKYD